MEENNFIHINIGRQIGAGGLEVANLLSKELNIKMYDKELITLAAKEIGFDVALFEKADEKCSITTFADSYTGGAGLFKIQSEVIKKLADQGDTIFVGRCADYILRDTRGCFNVFITASKKDRVARIRQTPHSELFTGWSDEKVADWLDKQERKRVNYYNGFTFKQWGYSASYNLCIDSSLFGVEGCVKMITSGLGLRRL